MINKNVILSFLLNYLLLIILQPMSNELISILDPKSIFFNFRNSISLSMIVLTVVILYVANKFIFKLSNKMFFKIEFTFIISLIVLYLLVASTLSGSDYML